MENVEKGSLGWAFMVLIHRLNFYERLRFVARVKRTY